MLKKPILFLIYNRSEITKKAFSAIRQEKPDALFIAADGPKNGDKGDFIKCKKTREVTEEIDWKCDVHRLYRKKNLGLKTSVYQAISWFFENVNEGIILEDDCVPHPSFFTFCEEMLQKYKNDSRVMHVSGSCFLPENMTNKNAYYFSKYAQVWGWATWKRAWEKMDYKMFKWKGFNKLEKYNSIFSYYWERVYWRVMANAVMKGKINSWAYRWQFSLWENGGKSISPGKNLVRNIGLHSGTHINTNVEVLGRRAESINDNPVLLGDKYSINADKYTMKNEYRISPLMVFAQWGYYLLKHGN